MAVAVDVGGHVGQPAGVNPAAGPGAGPAPGRTLAQRRQAGEFLSPGTKKRVAESNGVAGMQARRGRTSLMRKLLKDVVVDDDGEAAEANPARPHCKVCAANCPGRVAHGRAGCIHVLGGFEHLVKVHVEHLGTEPTLKARAKKHKDIFGGSVKARGSVIARRQRLLDRLDSTVWCEQAEPVEGGEGICGVYGYHFTLPHANGRPVVVCKNFFMAVLGYNRNSSQWNTGMDQAQKGALRAMMVRLGVDLPIDGETTTGILRDSGLRGSQTLMLFGQFIVNYAQSLPMRKELRFEFAHPSGLYDYLRSELVISVGEERAKQTLVGRRRFLQLLSSPQLLKQPAIVSAMKTKMAYHSNHNVNIEGWTLNYMDPSKKRDFSVCKCCAKLFDLRVKAIQKSDMMMYKRSCDLMHHHLRCTRMRQDKFQTNQTDAIANLTQVLSVIRTKGEVVLQT